MAAEPAPRAHGPRRLRRDAAHNQERIVEAARIVFAARGVDVALEEIAKQAGVGLATIYRRWSTKQELVIAAMQRAKASVEAPVTDDPRADLEALLREMTHSIFGPKACFVVGFVTALRSDPELGRVFRESMLADMRDHLRRPIARVVGEDDPDLDLRADLAPAFLIFRTLIDDRPALVRGAVVARAFSPAVERLLPAITIAWLMGVLLLLARRLSVPKGPLGRSSGGPLMPEDCITADDY